MTRLSVVLPARNEAGRIESCLASLGPFLDAGDSVVVVDDGSVDDTAALAERGGARVLRMPRGSRGLAAARGYEEIAATTQCVLLLHADMETPHEARARILDALDEHPEAVGGVLGHRIRDARIRFRWVERGNRMRARWAQLPYGDQAQFVRTEAVERSGGFPVQDRMEDLELAWRLRRLGRWLYLDCPVTIPSRHWREGVIRTSLRNWAVAARYIVTRRGSP